MENKNQKDQLSDLYSFIIEAVGPEKIFCLAKQSGLPGGTDYLDMLITMPEMPLKSALEVEIAMKLASLRYHDVAGTVCADEHIDELIREGNIYFNVACNNENLVYNRGNWKKPEISKNSYAEKKTQAYSIFYSGMRKANAFYSIARAHQENNLEMTAFLLHQAAELCLRTLMKALTGRDRHTHCLQELLLYSIRYSDELSLALANGTKEEKNMVKLLDKAYNDYRYADEYNVAENDINILMERIDKLLENAEQTFLMWLKKYDLLKQ